MARTVLWLIGGVLAGLIIHLAVILSLPGQASRDLWTRISALHTLDNAKVLSAVVPGAPNPLRLDPELSYAVCQLDLTSGPGVVSATLPNAFWSVAVYDRGGTVIYSTTNRNGLGANLNLGIFNAVQTHLLAEQQIDVANGLLIVESKANDVFVVVRLTPPYEAVRKRYETALAGIVCGNIGDKK